MLTSIRSHRSAVVGLCAALSFFSLLAAHAWAASSSVVISQVYGGGGNSGATYKNDFIELFNRGAAPVDVTGWSVQYASTTGSSWSNKTVLSGVIQPGQYYLVQEAAGSGGTVNLPTPDMTGSIAMAGGAGKVALVSNSTTLAGTCPSGSAIVDLVGYGTGTNCFEGAGPTATLSNTTAALRAALGCIDTDVNSADFSAGAPLPRNTVAPLNPCPFSTNPSATAATATPNNLEAGRTLIFQVTVSPGTNPTSSGLTVTGDLSPFGESSTQTFYDDGTNGDVISGDNIFTYRYTVPGGVAPGNYSVAVVIRDAQSRSGATSISLAILTPAMPVTIHDIQGSGAVSPYAGQRVVFTGIVTATTNNGFYVELSDVEQDGDPATSEGVFVYTGSTPTASIGNGVEVTGTVAEYGSTMPVTEIQAPSYTVLSSGNPLPTAVVIAPDPAGSYDQLERYEGMLVHIANPHVVGPTGGSTTSDGVFYVASGTVPRPFREPGLEPGMATALVVPNAPHFDGNPERIRVDTSARGGARAVAGTGDVISDIVGPLGFSTDYTVYPDPSFTATTTSMHAVPLPERGAREFTVATFNMLNFTSNTNRMQKASMAIREVMRLPDIIGVEEVNTLTTLRALATKINEDAAANGQGNPGYTAQLLAPSGSQNVGFLWRTDRLTDANVVQVGDSETMPGSTLPLNDRPPLVMTAKLLPPVGQPFPVTVIVNHLRSLIDVDADSSAGVFARTKRQLQAEYLANLVQQQQVAGQHVISVGDYNAYEFSDGLVDVLGTVKGAPAPADQVLLPTSDFVDPDLVDLITTLEPTRRYTYVENGNAQAIDHIVVTSELLARPYHLEIAHNDADFPASLAGDATRPERVSDHDMPVAYFTFPPPVADLETTLTGSTTLLSGFGQSYTIQVHNSGPDLAANVTLVDVLPSRMTFRSLTVAAGWTCTTPAVGSSGELRCTTASLASGADAQFTLETSVDCTTGNGAQLVNVAGVTSDTGDPDMTNNRASHQVTVSNPAPEITALSVDKPVLWSPNHKMVLVTLSYGTSDNCDTGVAATVAVSSNQNPETAATPHSIDWKVADATHVLLRAERTPPGDRVYTIGLTVTDSANNEGTATVQVRVPQSQSE